ncbi:MAG: hypothetical protein ACI8SG_000596, partial [Marinobacter psychrophilus]
QQILTQIKPALYRLDAVHQTLETSHHPAHCLVLIHVRRRQIWDFRKN